MTEEILIQPGGSVSRYWRELWQYRELFAVLAWRDVAVRYKQTVIGVAWALVRPLITMVVFTVVFGRIANLPSEGGAPYALMVFAGLLPWTLFATILSDSSNSLVGSGDLISKVYFPRMIVPAATAIVALVDFLVSLLILVGLMLWYRFLPPWQILLLPVFVSLALAASIGPGLLFTALTVKYRDFRYIIPFAVQLGLYISPVGFSSSVVPEQWRLLYSLNPLVGVIEGFRWCILGGTSGIDVAGFSFGVGVTGVFLWLGIRTFRRMEASLVDFL